MVTQFVLFRSIYHSTFYRRCGLVALCMSLRYLNIKCQVDELMKSAIDLSFTKQGEIFDGLICFMEIQIFLFFF